MLVKGFEGPDEDTAVLQDAPHPVVNVLQHLAAQINLDDAAEVGNGGSYEQLAGKRYN